MLLSSRILECSIIDRTSELQEKKNLKSNIYQRLKLLELNKFIQLFKKCISLSHFLLSYV